MSTNDGKLSITIVGSGLAGLAAAAVLRADHAVTVYERGDASVSTGGQGIAVAPNGLKVLRRRTGFDGRRAGGVPCGGYRSLSKDCAPLADFPIDFEARYSAAMLLLKRSDFRAELLRVAAAPASEEDGIRGDPATVVFGTAVVDLDPETASVTLADGTVVQSDVVIVADGIYSKLRDRITQDPTRGPKKTGLTLFRIAVSAADAREALGGGPLPAWWDAESDGSRLTVMQADDGTGRMIAHYPIQDHNYRNFSCLFPMRRDRGGVAESWYADGDKKEMLDLFRGYDEEVYKILSIATEVKVWDLQDMDPLDRWHRGRAILIGDAAHAMTPLQGQGANMAIEDADSLRLLRPGQSGAEIESVLARVDGIRRPRASRILRDTRAQAKDVTMEERLANLGYNCSYEGIGEV